jgi:Raf kinase inhibitor-like YbhB/YbcL family protein
MTDRPRPPSPYDFLPAVPTFSLTSEDLSAGGTLPDAQVYERGNTSPHLAWSGFPAQTKSFAVTCYDPDAPTGGGFWHWIVYDLPVGATELPTGAGTGDKDGMPDEAIHARNDYGTRDFGGAAPPKSDPPHRYFFVVHALDVESLDVDAEASANVVGFSVTAHTLARAILVSSFGF